MTPEAWQTGIGFQRVLLSGPSHPIVTVYPPGGWVPAELVGAARITVGQRPGFYGAIQHNGPDSSELTAQRTGAKGNALAWQYEPGAWALVEAAGEMTLGQMQAVATAIQFNTRNPLAVPIRLTYIPNGLDLKGVFISLPSNAPAAQGKSDLPTPGGHGPTITLGLGQVGSQVTTTEMTVAMAPISQTFGHLVGPNVNQVTIGKFHGFYAKGYLSIGDGSTAITIADVGRTTNGALSQAEITDIVKGIELSVSPDESGTWFNVVNEAH